MKNQRNLIFWLSIGSLCFLKYLLSGFAYYPTIDDYIGYNYYFNLPSSGFFADVFNNLAQLRPRFAAELFDQFVIAPFWDKMWISLCIITLLHIVSAYLFTQAFRAIDYSCSPVFVIIYLLIPMAFEAAYWVIAGARVIVGLFFVSLALWLYTKNHKALFGIALFISFGFYEQVTIVGFLLAMLVVYKMNGRKDIKQYTIPVLCLFAIGIYYVFIAEKGTRGSIVTGEQLWHQIKYTYSEVLRAFYRGFFVLNANGFVRGMGILMHNLWYAAIVVAVSIIAVLSAPELPHGKKPHILTLTALLVAPLLMFFVFENSIVPFRNIYVCIIPLGIFVASLVDRFVGNRLAQQVLMLIIILFFMPANVSETNDYKQVFLADKTICENIIEHIDDDVRTLNRDLVLVGSKWWYVPQNVSHREHIYNVTQSNWALAGALHHYLGNQVAVMVADEVSLEMLTNGDLVLIIDDEMNVSELNFSAFQGGI